MKRDIDFSDDDSPEEHECKKRAQKMDSMRMLQKLEVEKEANDSKDTDEYLLELLITNVVVFSIIIVIFFILNLFRG